MDQLQSLSSYLPPGDGLLPKWLLFISVVSIGNSLQTYVSLAGTREVYAGTAPEPATTMPSEQTASVPKGIPSSTVRKERTSPVNGLSARTFGTWTAISSVIRLYAAYNISNKPVYEMALWTFGIAFAHFVTEWLVFGTAKLGRGLAGPLIVSTATSAWMVLQWDHYVQ